MKKPNIDNEAKKIMVNREAYSEMIDALIGVKNYNQEPCQEHYNAMMELVNKALKKAGVEFGTAQE